MEEEHEEVARTKRKMIEKMKVVTPNPMAKKHAVALAATQPLRKLLPNLPTPTLFSNSDDQELLDLLKQLNPEKENAPHKPQ
jgi:hypothetical protein